MSGAESTDRVKTLHRPDEYEHESPDQPHVETYCRECSDYYSRSFVPWPCSTIRALRGDIADALSQAAAEWASEYDRVTREQPAERKSRAAYRMASQLADQRAAALRSDTP